MAEITVVGSINLDLVVATERIPRVGETVLGGDLARVPGGKGANQAVGAARLGRRVAMVGCVGDDDAGSLLLEALRRDAVDVEAVRRIPDVASGVALITVESAGDNTIVVAPGANRRFGADEVGRPVVSDAAVVLLQLEIPLDTVVAAASHARGIVVLNPAPAPARPLPHELLSQVDVLVPNESELAHMTGVEVGGDLHALADGARRLGARRLGAPAVVVTLGARGALVVDGDAQIHVPAPAVAPVDTTAAGDSFCAALGDALSSGRDIAEAARWAVRVGAVTTLRPGAQSSLPTRAEVDALCPA